MAIVNLTPDSFFAPSRVRAEQAQERIRALMAQGADGGAAEGPPGQIVFLTDADEIVDMFNERFFGRFESNYDLGEYIADECGLLANVPEDIARYFDFESYGRYSAFDFYEDGEYYFTAC